MTQTHFERLRAYQLAEELGDRVWIVVRKWGWFAHETMGLQLVRAADSIGANVAEGSGRRTAGDNRRFAVMARGSLYETRHWLRRAFRRHLLTSSETDDLKRIIDELTRVLNGYVRSLDAKRRREEAGEE
jgi:four helix bundle protein